MNTADLTALLGRLRAEPRKSEWLEFKANRYEPQAIGEHPCLANAFRTLEPGRLPNGL